MTSPLEKYKRKRNFTNTPEPKGKRAVKSKALKFVIQKHAATNLHYDFRLEMAGVLKSWAVPKGPSMNPADKRLAIMVEDHPIEYGKFKGIIPEGNYGAGIVEIWDEGSYQPVEKNAEPEKLLRGELKEGNLKFILKGKKLNGSFALVRIKNSEVDNQWLLIKKDDKFATHNKFDIASIVPLKPVKKRPHVSATKKSGEKKPSAASKKKALKI